VEFDFKSNRLDFGRISKDTTVTKTAVLQVLKPEKTKVLGITTSSPYVKAERVPGPSGAGDEGETEIEVTISPGLAPGKIHETVTVRSDLASKPEAQLHLTGMIVGDVEVTPDRLRFWYSADHNAERQILQHKVQIINRSADKTLKILDVRDSRNMLDLSLATVDEGRHYELTATLKKEDLEAGKGGQAGQLIITTNDPDQREISIGYWVIRRM
jgi:hypothetical protein